MSYSYCRLLICYVYLCTCMNISTDSKCIITATVKYYNIIQFLHSGLLGNERMQIASILIPVSYSVNVIYIQYLSHHHRAIEGLT